MIYITTWIFSSMIANKTLWKNKALLSKYNLLCIQLMKYFLLHSLVEKNKKTE